MKTVNVWLATTGNVKSYELNSSIFTPIICEDVKCKNTNGEIVSEALLGDLSAHYWALSNCKSDVVGLMQYRRLLSFGKNDNKEKQNSIIHEKFMCSDELSKYGINEEEIRNMADKYDVIRPMKVDIKKSGEYKNAYDFYVHREKVYATENFKKLVGIIEEKYPKYSDIISKALKMKSINLYNIFIMKKELFVDYSNFVFDVIFSLDDMVDKTYASYEQNKDYSLFAAFLLDIYCTSLSEKAEIQIKEVPVVEFEYVETEIEWRPAFDKNNVALVLSSSDYYVPYLATMIKSIIDNALDSNNYDINVLESAISKVHKQLVKSMAEDKENISIRFYNVNRKMDGIKLKAGGHISVETYFRLLIPEIFINYSKVLFLDSDMTVHTDIAELFNEDVKGYTVAAAHDQCIAAFYNGSDKSFLPYCKKVLKLNNHHDYFQAGVMLLNLDRFRERYTSEEIVEFATSRQFTYVDQDIMNSLCRGEVKHLDLSWNVFPDMGDYTKKFMPNDLRREYEAALENIKICHHTGPVKPWTNPCADTLMTYMFWSIARTTPFYEIMTYRLNHAVAYEYLMLSKKPKVVKKFVKEKMAMPIFNLMFPKGKKSRKRVKRWYFKVRGWELPTWELGEME